MKIISYFNAILTIEAPWDEVRPVAGAAFAAVSQLIKERYQFQAAGQSALSQQIGLMTPGFQGGQFRIGDKSVPINQFEFQPGTVLVTSATTEQATRFAEDVFEFLHKTLEFRIPPANRARHHVTAIVVDFGKSVVPMFGVINEIGRVLSSKIKNNPEFYPLGFRLARENQLPDTQYLFERRATTPAGEHWIYSQAPLDTASHIELLNTIDTLING